VIVGAGGIVELLKQTLQGSLIPEGRPIAKLSRFVSASRSSGRAVRAAGGRWRCNVCRDVDCAGIREGSSRVIQMAVKQRSKRNAPFLFWRGGVMESTAE